MPKILHIDDEQVNLDLSTIVLKKLGYEVVSSTNPLETINLLEEHQPVLLILDIVMPELDGLTLFDDLKAHYPPVPILFLTGWPQSFELTEKDRVDRWTNLFADGLTDILYKPFEPNDLRNKIEALIGPLEDMETDSHAESE